jgi:hypothetical protein
MDCSPLTGYPDFTFAALLRSSIRGMEATGHEDTAYDDKESVDEPCKPVPSRFWLNLLTTSSYFNGFVQPYVKMKAPRRGHDRGLIE